MVKEDPQVIARDVDLGLSLSRGASVMKNIMALKKSLKYVKKRLETITKFIPTQKSIIASDTMRHIRRNTPDLGKRNSIRTTTTDDTIESRVGKERKGRRDRDQNARGTCKNISRIIKKSTGRDTISEVQQI